MDKLFVDFRNGDRVQVKPDRIDCYGGHKPGEALPSFQVRGVSVGTTEKGLFLLDEDGFSNHYPADDFFVVSRTITVQEMAYIQQLQDLFDGVPFDTQEQELEEYKFKAKDTHL